MWRHAASATLLLALCVTARSAPAAVTGSLSSVNSPPNGSDTCTELYVEVVLNSRRLPDLAELCQTGSRLSATPQTLVSFGFLPGSLPAPDPSTGRLVLGTLSDVTVRYDALASRLWLDVPPDRLQVRRYQTGGAVVMASAISPSLPGVLVNYSLYGSRVAREATAGVWSEWQLTGSGTWSLTNSMQGSRQHGHTRNVRLDTRLTRDFTVPALSLTLGDVITGGPDWVRSTRLSGVQLARNFSLHPQNATAPDAELVGRATLPSTVDVFINNLRQTTQNVDPGPFDIGGMPVRNGINSVRMVVTDINGRQTVRDFSLYGAPDMLQAGLTDGSAEAGVVRRDWGVKSFSTDDRPVFSAGFRHGMTDSLTLNGHAEAGAGVQLVGGGLQWLPTSWSGVLNLDQAQSRAGGREGWLQNWGWHWNSALLSLSVNLQKTSPGWRDIAAGDDAPVVRQSRQLFAGLNTVAGSPALGLVTQEDTKGGTQRYESLSWSWSSGRATVSLTASRQSGGTKGRGLAVWMSLPLGERIRMSTAVTRARTGARVTTGVSGRPEDEDGVNWRVQHSMAQGRQESTLAEINRRGTHGDVSAGVSRAYGPDGTSLYGAASGSAVLLRQGVFWAPQVDGAFALVSTGAPDIPVLLENNQAGQTDARGYLLLSRLQPWLPAQVSLDVASIPDNWTLTQTRVSPVPGRHGGVLADLPVRRNVSVELRLHDEQGNVMPAGSAVYAGGVPVGQVGYGGVVWLADPKTGGRLSVDTGKTVCRVTLTASLIQHARQAPVQALCHAGTDR